VRSTRAIPKSGKSQVSVGEDDGGVFEDLNRTGSAGKRGESGQRDRCGRRNHNLKDIGERKAEEFLGVGKKARRCGSTSLSHRWGDGKGKQSLNPGGKQRMTGKGESPGQGKALGHQRETLEPTAAGEGSAPRIKSQDTVVWARNWRQGDAQGGREKREIHGSAKERKENGRARKKETDVEM